MISVRLTDDPNPRSPIPNPRLSIAFVADALLSVLLAPRCAVCQSSLQAPLAGPICQECWGRIRPITPPLCQTCGDPLPSWRTVSCGAARCPRCRRVARALDCGRTIGEYDGTLRRIIHALKYDGRRSIARPLGLLMRDCGVDVLEEVDWVVPVPLHPRRERARGFNQAADLARSLGLPVFVALRRVRNTTPQIELPAARRHANVRDAFRLAQPDLLRRRSPSALTNTRVLLVDDVSTTGATLEACARVLKHAGVREVRALTAARVVRRAREEGA